MKGILLAGGSGTRLFPITKTVSKQLLPIYDKPAIYYPLSTLMLAGIRQILVISTERDTPLIQGLLGDGSDLGIELEYKVQKKPEGIAQAFVLGADFVKGQSCCLILGDNLFYGHSMETILSGCRDLKEGAAILAYRVQEPQNFGVVVMDSAGKPLRIEEKPKTYISPWAVTGLYFYDATVGEKAAALKPSARGELEITDLNRIYLLEGKLNVKYLGRGVAWLDMGTPDNMLSSSQFVQTIEQRQGLKIACVEEIAFVKGYINLSDLARLSEKYPNSTYKTYLQMLVQSPEVHKV